MPATYCLLSAGFNPSFGFSGSETLLGCNFRLARDLVSIPRSGFLVLRLYHELAASEGSTVSIPRSGFLVLRRLRPAIQRLHGDVSIPRSGFLVLRLSGPRRALRRSCCFNPSFGFSGSETRIYRWITGATFLFQSLVRVFWF